MNGKWTAADQARIDKHDEARANEEAREELKTAEGMIEGLVGDLETALARIKDLEAVIEYTLHMAVRKFAATGNRDIADFCTSHLAKAIKPEKGDE